MSNEKIKVLLVEAGKKPKIAVIGAELEELQKVVGGHIEQIFPFEDEDVALVCNEEGKNNLLPLNRCLFDIDGDIYDIIAGTFFLCLARWDSECYESLSDEQLQKYYRRFEKPENFIKTENGLLILRKNKRW